MRLDELNVQDMLEDLPQWPVSRRLLAVLLAWLLMGVGFYLLFWRADFDTNGTLDKEIRSAVGRLNEQSKLLVEQPEIEARLAVLEAQLPVLKMALPSERELASLLDRVNDMILDQGLRLSQFTPQEPEQLEVMRVVPVNLTVRGDGATVAQLPNFIARLSRQVRLKEFEMSLLPEDGSWRMSGQLNAFAQLPQQQPATKEAVSQ